jgi:hypothetical protein
MSIPSPPIFYDGASVTNPLTIKIRHPNVIVDEFWLIHDESDLSKNIFSFVVIEIFNLALLARQAWRILQNPKALSARILKAISYPNGDFLEAQRGSHPSQIWRAIIDERDTLKQGLIRCIGTGEKTHAAPSRYNAHANCLQEGEPTSSSSKFHQFGIC